MQQQIDPETLTAAELELLVRLHTEPGSYIDYYPNSRDHSYSCFFVGHATTIPHNALLSLVDLGLCEYSAARTARRATHTEDPSSYLYVRVHTLATWVRDNPPEWLRLAGVQSQLGSLQ